VIARVVERVEFSRITQSIRTFLFITRRELMNVFQRLRHLALTLVVSRFLGCLRLAQGEVRFFD